MCLEFTIICRATRLMNAFGIRIHFSGKAQKVDRWHFLVFGCCSIVNKRHITLKLLVPFIPTLQPSYHTPPSISFQGHHLQGNICEQALLPLSFSPRLMHETTKQTGNVIAKYLQISKVLIC